MICGEPQMPAALLIGSNSESFGSKLHATTILRPDVLWLFFCPAQPQCWRGFVAGANSSHP